MIFVHYNITIIVLTAIISIKLQQVIKSKYLKDEHHVVVGGLWFEEIKGRGDCRQKKLKLAWTNFIGLRQYTYTHKYLRVHYNKQL